MDSNKEVTHLTIEERTIIETGICVKMSLCWNLIFNPTCDFFK